MIAGPGINFLFAILLFFLLAIPSEDALKPELGSISANSVMGNAGISEGDRLVSIDGRAVKYHREHDLYIFNQVLRGENLQVTTSSQAESAEPVLRVSQLDVSGIPIYNINPSFIVRELGLSLPMPEITTKLQRVLANSRAESAGLLVGDTITEVDGKGIESWRDLVAKITSSPEQSMLLTLKRGDSTLRVSVTPEVKESGAIQLGIAPTVLPWSDDQKVTITRTLPQALVRGIEQTWLMSAVTLRMLWKMVTLQVSHKNISGPITIADVAGQAIQVGFDSYLYILAVISISLGVMNLLPIPMLDGGHLLMYAVELVGGKNLSEQVFAVGQRLGIVMLIGLMSLAFYNDIFRLLN